MFIVDVVCDWNVPVVPPVVARFVSTNQELTATVTIKREKYSQWSSLMLNY